MKAGRASCTYRKYAILLEARRLRLNGEFMIEYVELPNGRMPAR